MEQAIIRGFLFPSLYASKYSISLNIHVSVSNKGCLRPHSARKTSTTGAKALNGNEIGSQWHVCRHKLCSSIDLHFVTRGQECLELKSVFRSYAGGCFSRLDAPSTYLCAGLLVSLHVSPYSSLPRRLPTRIGLSEG